MAVVAPRYAPLRPSIHQGERIFEVTSTEMNTDDICYSGVHELAARIQRREISPVEIVDAYLRRIEALNPRLSAYLTLTAESAREEALRAETEISAGRWRGPLHGLAYGVKDIFETKGGRTTHGSSFFRDFVPDPDPQS